MKERSTANDAVNAGPHGTAAAFADDLEQAIERVKLDLLSLVSHELRTPLTSVLNSLRMLQDEEENFSPIEKKQFLDMAYRNAERLNSTLAQLLDLSKLVSGRLICRFHEVALKTLVRELVQRFENDVERGGFRLKISGEANLPVILGDAPRLEQVVRSLFENALKFAPPAAELALKIKEDVKFSALPAGMQKQFSHDKQSGRFVVFELMNPVATSRVAGKGDEVFKIFGQQEGILDRMYEGVGGSLAIGAEVLRQHGGALYADGQAGKFTVWMALPVLESESALIKVLESRMYALKTEVGSISLMVLEVGPKTLKQIVEALKAALFRASDTVYSLSDTNQIAVVMDDCKKADAPKIVGRLLEGLGPEAAKFLKDRSAKVGLASGPDDATDPEHLLEKARSTFVPIVDFRV